MTLTTTAAEPHPASPAALFPRVGTGNREADDILGGGFPANSINIVMGQPGSGKTIFVEQLLFHNADAPGAEGARPVLYLTTLSEPLTKVLSYLQRFGFYDEEKLGASVVYEDVGAELTEGGVAALVPRLREIIKTLSPRVIVIDSFKALHDLEPSLSKMRCTISELAGLLTAYETTTFLVGEYAEENNTLYPEFAVADSIVELARKPLSTRDERYFRVFKLRGSVYREGYHGMRITGAGLEIFPRLVTPEIPPGYAPVLERTTSGTAGLDAMLGGGLWRGSTTLLAGPTGSGKTTIAMHFALEGIRRGEPSLYVHFQENPTQMARLIRAFGTEPADAESRGLHLLYASPVELQIDSIVVEIFRLIRDGGIRRVVIDAVGELYAAATDSDRLHDYLYALVQHFAVSSVTSMLTFETVGLGGVSAAGQNIRFSYMSDNIVLLELVMERDQTRRTVRALKTRNSAHDPAVRELEIGSGGARVLGE